MKSQLNCFKSTSNDLPDEDSRDLAYVRKVLEFIDSHPTMFQKEKIYIGGKLALSKYYQNFAIV